MRILLMKTVHIFERTVKEKNKQTTNIKMPISHVDT